MQEQIDRLRVELLIKYRDLILQGGEKDYINSPLWEIENTLKRGRGEFSEEQMLKNIRSFLSRQKGITRIHKGYYEISRELELIS